MKFNKIGWVIRLLIFAFLFRYILSITSLFEYEEYDFDSTFFYLLFLVTPLFFSVIYVSLYKSDVVLIYFAFFVAQWIVFLNVNPYPLDMNNKFAIMERFPEKNRPSTQFMLADIYFKEFEYPIIIKPIVCSGKGAGIEIINDKEELDKFMLTNPDFNYFMVQNYLEDHNIEIGVLYEKYPWEIDGRILEIAEKTNNDKIRAFVSSQFKKHTELVTNQQVLDIFHNLIKQIPGANAVRFDVRLKDIADLEKGDFKIVEMNGTMGMPYYKDFDLLWFLRRFLIGSANTLSLNGYSPLSLPVAMYKSFMNMHNCNDYENLWSLYS